MTQEQHAGPTPAEQQTPGQEAHADAPLPETVPAEPGAAAAAARRAGELETDVTKLQEEVAKLKDQLLRAMAETENVRRRLEQQAEDRGKYAVSSFAKDMLPVADNLRRAIENIPADAIANDALAQKLVEGVELTERSMLSALERHGINRIASMGERFDPHLHQAMMEIEDPSHPAGTVVLEMQTGYTIHGRLLREAMVGVSKGGPKPQPGDAGVDTTV